RPPPPVSSPFPYTTLFRSHEPHAEQRGDEPEQQVQKAHPRDGFGGLRKNPRHGREADQQDRHQHQQTREQAADFREARLRTAQTDRKSTRLNSSHLGISYA